MKGEGWRVMGGKAGEEGTGGGCGLLNGDLGGGWGGQGGGAGNLIGVSTGGREDRAGMQAVELAYQHGLRGQGEDAGR